MRTFFVYYLKVFFALAAIPLVARCAMGTATPDSFRLQAQERYAMRSDDATRASIVATPASIAFDKPGQTQTVSASESGYSGALTASSSDPSVATVGDGAQAGTWTVTAAGRGSATITIADTNRHYARILTKVSLLALTLEQYISSATHSVAVTQDGQTLGVVSLSPSSSASCSGSPIACHIELPGNAGKHTFVVSLYDGSNGSGHVLSIGSGKANISETGAALKTALSGVVSSLKVALTNPNPALGSPATSAVDVTAADADGEPITGDGDYVDSSGADVKLIVSDSDKTKATKISGGTVTKPTAKAPELSYDGAALTGPVTISAAGPGMQPATTLFPIHGSYPTATPAPAPTNTSGYLPKDAIYDPPVDTYPYFAPSIFRAPLSNPVPNANSASWVSHLGTMGINTFQFAADTNGLSRDYMFPIYNGNNSGHTYTIHCTEHYGGNCSIEGKTVTIESNMLPEDSTATYCNGDCHATFIENGYEYDFWKMQPLSGNTVTIGWGGSCPFTGPGYQACAGTASGTALSQGIIRAQDWVFAAQTGGTLPYAIQAAVNCSNGSLSGFGSDGTCSGGVPQGSRGYLAMHDAQVNDLPLTSLAKALLRTIDEDHYGVVITDTDGGQSGLCLQGESDLTYTAFGKPGPWATTFVNEARAEGIGVSLSNDVDYVSVPFSGVDWSKFKFM